MSPQAEQIGCWPIDEPFPAVLRDIDLRRVVPYGHSRFYTLKKKGAFHFLEMRPALSADRTLYSGHLVRQWTRGELGASRYFQKAAQRSADVVPMAGRRPGRPRKSVSLGAAVHASTVASAAEVDESTVGGSTRGGW